MRGLFQIGAGPIQAKGGEAMSIRILIVDDHGVVREGLKMYLALDPELAELLKSLETA